MQRQLCRFGHTLCSPPLKTGESRVGSIVATDIMTPSPPLGVQPSRPSATTENYVCVTVQAIDLRYRNLSISESISRRTLARSSARPRYSIGSLAKPLSCHRSVASALFRSRCGPTTSLRIAARPMDRDSDPAMTARDYVPEEAATGANRPWADNGTRVS